jgi:hypothetical protein
MSMERDESTEVASTPVVRMGHQRRVTGEKLTTG